MIPVNHSSQSEFLSSTWVLSTHERPQSKWQQPVNECKTYFCLVCVFSKNTIAIQNFLRKTL